MPDDKAPPKKLIITALKGAADAPCQALGRGHGRHRGGHHPFDEAVGRLGCRLDVGDDSARMRSTAMRWACLILAVRSRSAMRTIGTRQGASGLDVRAFTWRRLGFVWQTPCLARLIRRPSRPEKDCS